MASKISLHFRSKVWQFILERCKSPVAARVSTFMPGATRIQLTPQQQDELDRCAGSRSLTAGKAKQEIAVQLGIARQTAGRWERRFREQATQDWRTRPGRDGRA